MHNLLRNISGLPHRRKHSELHKRLRTCGLSLTFLCGFAMGSWGNAQESDARHEITRRTARPSTSNDASPRMLPIQFRAVDRDTRAKGSSSHEPNRPSTIKQAAHQEDAPLPLARPRGLPEGQSKTPTQSGPTRGALATFTTICLVVGAACAMVWLARRGLPTARGRLPEEALECLGRASLGPKLEVHLLRIGGKLLLVGSSANSHQTLTEITAPEEVERIVAACATERGASVAASMQRALAQLDAPTGAPPSRRLRRSTREIADA
ncbi:MAG: flagellar biosynthetic protein FliO [Pirellulales bacterium]